MPEFTTNEERIRYAEELAAKKKALDLIEYDKQHGPYGGDQDAKRSCTTCRFNHRGKHTYVTRNLQCRNPAVNLQGKDIASMSLRGASGLCGPDGIYYKKVAFVNRNANKILAIAGISALVATVSVAIAAFGFQPVLIGLGLLVFICIMGSG